MGRISRKDSFLYSVENIQNAFGSLDGRSLQSWSLDRSSVRSLDGWSLDGWSLDGWSLDGGSLDRGSLDGGSLDRWCLPASLGASSCWWSLLRASSC